MRYIIPLCLLLAACAGPDDHHACLAYGAQPGTQFYMNCRVQLERNRIAQSQANTATLMLAAPQVPWTQFDPSPAHRFGY